MLCVSQRQDVYYHIEKNNASTFFEKIEEIFYFVCKVYVIQSEHPDSDDKGVSGILLFL